MMNIHIVTPSGRRYLCSFKLLLVFAILCTVVLNMCGIYYLVKVSALPDVYNNVWFNPEISPVLKQCYGGNEGPNCDVFYFFGFESSNQISHFMRYQAVVSRFDSSLYYDLKVQEQPLSTRNCKSTHKFGILPRRLLYGGNLGHFLDEVFGVIYTTIIHIRKTHNTNEIIPVFYAPVVTHARLASYEPFFSALGSKLIFIQNNTEPTCIENFFVISTRGYIALPKDAVLQISQHINPKCSSDKKIIILQRAKTRNLVNANDIVKHFKSHGISDVQIVQFENLSILQQMKTVMCSKVFIGVHGAGMAWFHFLPQDGVFVEIGPNGWRKSFYSDLVRKVIPFRNIQTYNYDCDVILSEEDKMDENLMSEVRKGQTNSLDTKFPNLNCTIDVNQFHDLINVLNTDIFSD